jgi:uncharacterized protein (TIGR03435 family)
MQTSETKLAFEVASVKPSTFGPGADGLCRGGPATSDPGRFTCRYVELKRIIVRAFGVRTFQVVAPDWTQYQRFDIDIVVPKGATKEQFAAMLLSLLIDRFHLAFHREPRQTTRYELLVTEGGPKLKEAREALAAASGEAAPAPPARPDPATGSKIQVDKAGYPIRTTPGFGNVDGRARFYEPHGPIESLLPLLDMIMDAPVINASGLQATYEIEIHWGQSPIFGQTRAPQARANGGLPPAGQETAPDVGPGGPSIQQALREQLGLKLERKKGPVEMLVVDHVDRVPTEN